MRQLLINRVSVLLVAVLLLAGSVEAAALSLNVTVETTQNNVKNGGFLPVIINIRNVGDAVQTLHLYSCSHQNNWITDNPFVSLVDGPCKKDVLRVVNLKEGEIYKQTETVRVTVPAKDVSISSLNFRLGFRDGSWGNYNQLPSSWSNQITINVME
jgi:hypothetical protein